MAKAPVIEIPPREELLKINPTLLRRFMCKVDVGDFKRNACWLWRGSTTRVRGKSYYGTIGIKMPDGSDVVVKAHRIAVVLQQGLVRPDLEVSHICEVGLCVNPTHLVEMSEKGHDEADRIAKEVKGHGAFERWNIPHQRLWDGWGLAEYNEIAERYIREQTQVVVQAQAVLAEMEIDYR